MKKLSSVISLVFIIVTSLSAQKKTATEAVDSKADKPMVPNSQVRVDTTINGNGQITVKGQIVPYSIATGTMPVWDEDGKAVAGVFYTYYERSDVKDHASRPLVISFNGGPGTPSVWMEIGYTGPRILNVDDEGYPVQPYGMRDNPYSIIDVADIVYIDPVNTGFSRTINKEISNTRFFGVNADIKYLAEWLNTFVSRKKRWASPKFLIGESYGTTRVSGLALELQNSQWMYLNGVVLVSPTDLGIKREGPVDAALMLPYYAATAWYHKKLSPELQSKDLEELLPEVERFTIDQFVPALAKGNTLTDADRKSVTAAVSRYSGLSESAISQHNMTNRSVFFLERIIKRPWLYYW